ncbi:MAG TPA: DUF5362 family protein [Dyella sp.]|uniref:DUF5362 family protein n=1 Tax=Dyella sp. TaxID=1869338 RepID=UPI002F936691
MSSQFNPPPFGNGGASVAELADPLAQGSGWIKFLAIVQLVFSGISVLASFGFGLIVAWLPIWLSILLLQTASAIEQAQVRNDAVAMKSALGKLRLYFMIQAVAMIVGFCLSILGIIAVVSLGLSMHNLPGSPFAN